MINLRNKKLQIALANNNNKIKKYTQNQIN